MASETCGMCGGNIPKNDYGTLGETGLKTISRISNELNDGLCEKLTKMSVPIPIHASCRRKYQRPSVIDAKKKRAREESQSNDSDVHTSRSKVKKYNPYTDCCFCNQVIPYFKNCSKDNPTDYDTKIPLDLREHCAETKPLINTILKKAKERKDDWGKEVEFRLTPYNDLPAIEAKLHGYCQVFSLKSCFHLYEYRLLVYVRHY